MNWLLDTDVICQPAKKHGDARVISWLEEEQDRCYDQRGGHSATGVLGAH